MKVFYIIFLVVIGCCVGSFLNVVVYRLPLGWSLSYPPSHCPHCKCPIRIYDNIPVLSWFFLFGRCRDCRCLISFRYPFIEAFSGVVSGSISVVVFYSQAALSYFELCVISLYYFVLVITLFTAGMIEFDRNKVPAQLFFPATLITPFMFYYFDRIQFYTMLNQADLFFAILAVIICGVLMLLNFIYLVKPVVGKEQLPRKTKKTKKPQNEFSLQIIVSICLALMLGLGCGLIAAPVLFYAAIVAAICSRYKKKPQFYLNLTGAIWATIILLLLKGNY
jgi:prepilin signal peptidase PulO-like enzyme (type II secretory pathway)